MQIGALMAELPTASASDALSSAAPTPGVIDERPKPPVAHASADAEPCMTF
jgi:hypothetical protein